MALLRNRETIEILMRRGAEIHTASGDYHPYLRNQGSLYHMRGDDLERWKKQDHGNYKLTREEGHSGWSTYRLEATV